MMELRHAVIELLLPYKSRTEIWLTLLLVALFVHSANTAEQAPASQMLLSAYDDGGNISMESYCVYTSDGKISEHKPSGENGRFPLNWRDDDQLIQCFFHGIIVSFKAEQLKKLGGTAIRVDLRVGKSDATVQVPRPKIDKWLRLLRPGKASEDQQLSAFSFSENSKPAVRTEIPTQANDWITIVFPDGAHSIELEYTGAKVFFNRTRIQTIIGRDITVTVKEEK